MSTELREKVSRDIWLGVMPMHGMAGLYAAPDAAFLYAKYSNELVVMRCSKQ
jgi:hypothetical protein